MLRIIKSFFIGFFTVFIAKTVYYMLRDRNK
jgi:cbb3-type cytochrome oxidase subunit 3